MKSLPLSSRSFSTLESWPDQFTIIAPKYSGQIEKKLPQLPKGIIVVPLCTDFLWEFNKDVEV